MSSSFLFAQINPDSKLSKASFLGTSEAIRNYVDVPITDYGKKQSSKDLIKSDFRNRPLTLINDNQKNYKDPLITNVGTHRNTSIEFDNVFEGINRVEAFQTTPPDPNGDVGKEYYVEVTNAGGGSLVMVTDKQGNRVTNPFNLNSLWAQFGLSGFGDPIVLYDQFAERWLISEFASLDQNTMMIAISTSNDPTGSYYAYAVSTPNFPDYPKFSVWTNGYFITTNEPESFIPVYVLDRQAMLEGNPEASIVRLETLNKFNTNSAFQVASPVDLTGNHFPKETTPHYTVRIYDNSWVGGADRIELWPVDIDWSQPETIQFGSPTLIPTSIFESGLCNTLFDCLDQPGGLTIAALQHVIMNRAVYRNFDTHESILINFSVDLDGTDRAGIRWIELRKEEGEAEFSLYQEGTIGADDGLNRFMASSAMDASGNIAIAYSVTNSFTPLELRMTGRLESDSLGIMSFDETVITDGNGNNDSRRWGDYFSMSVDPIDDRTFWFTGEYMISNGRWGTKIAVFKLEKDSIDMAPVTILNPNSSNDLDNVEPVEVTVKNLGLDTINKFNLSLFLNDEDIVTDVITMDVAPNGIFTHVFSQTVDLSVAGKYLFEISTQLEGDQNSSNNTISLQREKLRRNDVSLSGVTGLGELVCLSSIDVLVHFLNLGTEELLDLDINYQLNGGAIQSFQWNGNLDKYESGQLEIPVSDIQEGMNELLIILLNPNQGMDEDESNNSRVFTFEYKPDGQLIQFTFQGDEFSSESSWELANSGAQILFTSIPYPNGGVLINQDWCLDEDCYTFTILDSYGDGINSPAPGIEPTYRMVDQNGILVAEILNRNFGFFEIQTFCIPYQCLLDFESSSGDASSSDQSDGSISIEALNFLPPVEYSIDGGLNFQQNSTFLDLLPGEYEVVVKDHRGCQTFRTVTVDVMSPSFELEGGIVVSIHPNPVSEKVKLSISGLLVNDELAFDLLDISGQVLQRRKMVKFGDEYVAEISLIPYVEGIYLIRFKNPSFNKIYQLVKI